MAQLLRMVLMILKIIEMVVLVVGMATVAFFIDKKSDLSHKNSLARFLFNEGVFGRMEFFVFATSIGLVVAITALALLIFKMQEKIKWAVTFAAIYALWALVLLVSSSLLAKTVNEYNRKTLPHGETVCSIWKKPDVDATCDHLITGMVFGFFSMMLFVADAIIYLHQYVSTDINFTNMANVPA